MSSNVVILFWLTFFILVTLLIITGVMKGKINLRLGSGGLWEKNKNTVFALSVIAGSLIFSNWLCSLVGWHWWAANYEKGLFFWVSQVAITLSVYALMSTKKFVARVFPNLVLAIVIAGWITFAHLQEPTILKAGQWTRFEVPVGKIFQVETPPGVPFALMVNDDKSTITRTDTVGGTIHRPLVGIKSFSVRTDTDTEATVKFFYPPSK